MSAASTSASLLAQWQANRRLRIAVGVVLLVLLAHGALALSDSRAEGITAYQADRALLLRLQGAAADAGWAERAAQAEEALDAMEGRLMTAEGAGEAQAELQAQLTALANAAGIADARVRSEAALPVDGLPGLWLVVARLDAQTPSPQVEGLLAALAAQPWLRVERIEVRDGQPAQLQLFVRAYVRDAAAGEGA